MDDKEEGPNGLTEEESQKVEELKRRDAEVRAHEQAHAAVGGAHAGAPRFRFVRGPDGKFYAVAGEVTIDTSAVPGNPRATIRKMQLDLLVKITLMIISLTRNQQKKLEIY